MVSWQLGGGLAARRAVLRALPAGLWLSALGTASASALMPARIATIDWAVLETLLAIGVVPVAAAEIAAFRRIAIEPEVPGDVVDIGLRGTPSFEALRLVRPELILSSNFYVSMEARLGLIAPVETLTVFSPRGHAYDVATQLTLDVGARTGRETAARDLVTATAAELAHLADDLASRAQGTKRPVILINLGDDRHFRVFGRDSIFGGVLDRLGLANAWTTPTSYAATAPIGLERLAQFPDATIVIVPPVPPEATRALSGSAFWQALPSVAAGRLITLAPVNAFGALPAARRFARLLVAALTAINRAGAGGDRAPVPGPTGSDAHG